MKSLTCFLLACATLSVLAVSSQQVRSKISRLHMNAQGHAILNAAERAGADVSQVSIRMQHRGQVVKLNGSVPSSNDWDTIQTAAQMSGPFKDIRNFIQVQPPSSDADGITMRDRDYLPTSTVDALKKGLKHCPVCQLGTPCYQLYLEHEKLEKELKDKYLMASAAQRNTYKLEAVKLTTRLKQIEDLMNASLCYEIATGKISADEAKVIIEEDEQGQVEEKE